MVRYQDRGAPFRYTVVQDGISLSRARSTGQRKRNTPGNLAAKRAAVEAGSCIKEQQKQHRRTFMVVLGDKCARMTYYSTRAGSAHEVETRSGQLTYFLQHELWRIVENRELGVGVRRPQYSNRRKKARKKGERGQGIGTPLEPSVQSIVRGGGESG